MGEIEKIKNMEKINEESKYFTHCLGCFRMHWNDEPDGRCAMCEGRGTVLYPERDCPKYKGTGTCPGCIGSGFLNIDIIIHKQN